MDESATSPVEQAVARITEKVGLTPLMQDEVIQRVAGAFPMKSSRRVPALWCGVSGLSEQLETFEYSAAPRADARVYGKAHGVVHINGQDFPVLVVPIKFDETALHQLSYDAQCVARFLRSRKTTPDYDLHIIVVETTPAPPISQRKWTVRAERFT